MMMKTGEMSVTFQTTSWTVKVVPMSAPRMMRATVETHESGTDHADDEYGRGRTALEKNRGSNPVRRPKKGLSTANLK